MIKTSRDKHFVIWGAWYGSHNVGDQVLLLTIADILGKMFNGDVRFTVLTDNPDHVMEYTARDSQWRFQPLHNRRQFPQVVKAISACDLFIFGGGVPFFEQPQHLAAMALIISIARAAGTPYMTWAVSSQAIKSPTAKRLFKWVLNGAQALTCRDKHTYNLFLDCGVKQHACIVADPGFWLEPESDERAWEFIARAGYKDKSRPLVALTPRTLRAKDGEAETHYQVKTPEQTQREIDCYSAAADWLWEHGYQPIFIPMHAHPPDDDRIASRQVVQSAHYGSHCLIFEDEVFPRLAPAIYRQCAFSIVSRVHGSITSMIANCPFIMYAFDLKHVGIMEAMHLSQYCLPEASATVDQTIALLVRIASENAGVRAAMSTRFEALRQDALVPAQLASQILTRYS